MRKLTPKGMQPKTENPLGCPVCGGRWIFVSDAPWGNGIIKAVHPDGPCVPRVETYLPDDADDDGKQGRGGTKGYCKTLRAKTCAECDKGFTTRFARVATCSSECARSRRQAWQRGYYTKRVERWQRTESAA